MGYRPTERFMYPTPSIHPLIHPVYSFHLCCSIRAIQSMLHNIPGKKEPLMCGTAAFSDSSTFGHALPMLPGAAAQCAPVAFV
eukprot:scaffold5536_cov19-Tisochrysis_lutea.AAC.1